MFILRSIITYSKAGCLKAILLYIDVVILFSILGSKLVATSYKTVTVLNIKFDEKVRYLCR